MHKGYYEQKINYIWPNPARITKAGKDFAKKLDFKAIKFPRKIKDIHKIEKQNSTSISEFGYENKEKTHPSYVSRKCCVEKHVDFVINTRRQKTPCFYKRF